MMLVYERSSVRHVLRERLYPSLVSPVNSKEQSQSSDCLFSSREVVHWSEPLSWSHTVIVDAVQIRLLRVFWAQKSLQTNNGLRVKALISKHNRELSFIIIMHQN